jgi:membrane protease subunit (stomatin/prohibitin family)
VKQKWPLTDVTSGAYTQEIEASALGGLRAEVDGYGLEIVRFGDFHIAMGEEDERNLSRFYEKAGYINMAGGLGGYQQLAQADMMMNAGQGMAKGGGGAGLEGAGIGLGFAMAGQLGQMGSAGHATPGLVNLPPTGATTPTAGAGTVICAGCKASVAPGKFCPECGKALASGPKFCTGCGKAMSGKFCAECGAAAPA